MTNETVVVSKAAWEFAKREAAHCSSECPPASDDEIEVICKANMFCAACRAAWLAGQVAQNIERRGG